MTIRLGPALMAIGMSMTIATVITSQAQASSREETRLGGEAFAESQAEQRSYPADSVPLIASTLARDPIRHSVHGYNWAGPNSLFLGDVGRSN